LTGATYAEAVVNDDDRVTFGWVHSLDHIPWNEYYHVNLSNDADSGTTGTLVLDAITVTAFGAGIPENKGTHTYVDVDGLIHMEGIAQVFTELTWLNSHYATRDIAVNGIVVTTGADLPEHTRVTLTIGGT
jgi:hypothetical protein